jgi:hypothetical protein
MWTLLLILPGLIAAYLILLRPVLKAMPALKTFYEEADGFWAKAWAVCGNSLTMVWSYFVLAAGALLNQVDNIAATLGDPNFKQQVAQLIGTDPKALGYFAMTVSAVTIAARLRSIAKG